jgi:fumarate hydratase, class I
MFPGIQVFLPEMPFNKFQSISLSVGMNSILFRSTAMKKFTYEPLFSPGPDSTEYQLLSDKHVKVLNCGDLTFLDVSGEGLILLAREAMRRVNFYLRPSHNKQVAEILNDPEASENDRYVARAMLKNAVISAGGQLPFCQDTGTAIVMGWKGQQVLTEGNDPNRLSEGIFQAYQEENLRYSQVAPLDMYREKNTGTNLPAQIEIYSTAGDSYNFLFVSKGGGSANKSFLYQKTKAVLNSEKLLPFLLEKMKSLGTSGCPPYHLAFVIGGTSAEYCLKTVKLATTGYLDGLPASGNELGRSFRDHVMENLLLKESRNLGIGAQFGGTRYLHDVRVIRMARHGASCPIGVGVSCSADRNIKAKINKDGIWLEKMDYDPSQWLLPAENSKEKPPVHINLERPMPEILKELSKHPVKTRVTLTGKLIVARDMAHARLKEILDSGSPLPEYFKNHPVYYAGPAKTPAGMPSGSFGPTTAERMDPYVEEFQANGGSLIMIAKGNRSSQVSEACKKYGGFYLGSIGGPAALLAHDHIRKVSVLDFPEFGMEAVWEIEVEDFPVFILVDDKGNDFYADI